MERLDNRKADQLRPVTIKRDFQMHPTGSALIEFGDTRVVCAVTVLNGIPRWMREQKVSGGWLTAEYQMLPSATPERNQRESSRGRPSGRSQEIQRLIGRSLRSVVDLETTGARTLQVDCDVLDADGGTRCAAVTGACVALELALRKLFVNGDISSWPMKNRVAAVSVGMLDGDALLDLDYREDNAAQVDMNIVMTDADEYVEVQGTAEEKTFSRSDMEKMLALGRKGVGELFDIQKRTLK